ncbi:MAG TPA: hypothetical protein VHP31_01535 [Caproicibacter sp.]|nr:hypothetical protein [Caproicibacter sp.]
MVQIWPAIWKSVLIFFILVILARLIGRKVLSQMSYFDFTIAITIGTVASSYVSQSIKGLWVLLSPAILAALAVLFNFVYYLSPHVRIREMCCKQQYKLWHHGLSDPQQIIAGSKSHNLVAFHQQAGKQLQGQACG